MTKLIGFSGKKQSGKNTCANFIYSMYLVNQNLCEKAKVNDIGTIDIVKNNGASITIDINEYYIQPETSTLDQEVLSMIDKLNPYIKLYSFADILKQDICMKLLGLTYKQCYGSDLEKNEITNVNWQGKYLTAREVMQIVGTDIFRSMRNNIWPETTIEKILKDKTELGIITDCRFPNEVEAIKNNNGEVIRLTRDKLKSNDHASEIALDKDKYDWSNFDYVIDNENLSIYDQSLQLYSILQTMFA